MKPILFFILFICLCSSANSQGSFNGCIYSNVVYTVRPNGSRFNGNAASAKTLSVGYCSWTPSTGTACTICLGGTWSGSTCSTGGGSIVSGLRNTYTMVLCPIDNNLIILLISLLLTTAYFIKINRSILLYK